MCPELEEPWWVVVAIFPLQSLRTNISGILTLFSLTWLLGVESSCRVVGPAGPIQVFGTMGGVLAFVCLSS